jgi:DNA-binding transcriptional regulator PaaX
MASLDWILLNYTLPKDPSRIRVGIWRKLKRSGAVILGQSLWYLPKNDSNQSFFKTLAQEIESLGGTATLMNASALDETTERRILDAFQNERNEEYSELIERCNALISELKSESDKGKFTFAELEENEDEFSKLTDWMARIKSRDFSNATLQSDAESALDQSQKALQEFSTKVYNHSI